MLSVLIRRILLVVLLIPTRAWGWNDDGHEIVAVIAADNLTPAAQSHVASILGVTTNKITAAMEAASIRRIRSFPEEGILQRSLGTSSICRLDSRVDVARRSPSGNCVTAKIDEYTQRLKAGRYDRWGADGDLALLIHFVAASINRCMKTWEVIASWSNRHRAPETSTQHGTQLLCVG